MGTPQPTLNGSSREVMPGAFSEALGPLATKDDIGKQEEMKNKSEANNRGALSQQVRPGTTPIDEDKIGDGKQPKVELKASVGSYFVDDMSGAAVMAANPNSYANPVTAPEGSKEREPRKATTLAQEVEKVREAFGVSIIPYEETDLRPHHPKHPRNFNSKNLRCCECEGNCQICQAACCRYQHLEALAKDTTISRSRSEEMKLEHAISLIDFWVPTGTDLPTFLMCSTCRRHVCPGCCGICPDRLICQDIQCIQCKPDPWAVCDWHD